MSLDKKIKDSFNQEHDALDQIMSSDQGLITKIADVYSGSMRVWVALGSAIALFVTVGFIYACYRFWIAEVTTEQLFWAVWFIVGLMAQIAIKMWIFMEMNRVATLKELKRTELRILKAIDSD